MILKLNYNGIGSSNIPIIFKLIPKKNKRKVFNLMQNK